MCKAQDEARWAAMRRRMENFFTFGSCSGRPPRRYEDEERFHVVIGARPKPLSASELAWNKGLRANMQGKWAAEAIMSVRRCSEGRGWEALVEWRGEHDSSWVPLRCLDKQLREEAQAQIREATAPEYRPRRFDERSADGQESAIWGKKV